MEPARFPKFLASVAYTIMDSLGGRLLQKTIVYKTFQIGRIVKQVLAQYKAHTPLVNGDITKLVYNMETVLDFYQELIFARIRLRVSGLMPKTEAMY